MKRVLLFLLIFFLLTSVTWGDPGIDIGAPAIDRTNTFSDDMTVIEGSNPANASGIITSVQIYTRFGADALRIGTFSKDGDVFTCRHSVAVGDAIDGWNEFSELSIEVETGDYIGFYFYGEGGIERSLSGGVGVWYKSGEYIDPEDEATYTFLAGNIASLYGTGTEGGAPPETHRRRRIILGDQ